MQANHALHHIRQMLNRQFNVFKIDRHHGRMLNGFGSTVLQRPNRLPRKQNHMIYTLVHDAPLHKSTTSTNALVDRFPAQSSINHFLFQKFDISSG